jgi:hypothetical protein
MHDFVDWLLNFRLLRPMVDAIEWIEDKVRGNAPLAVGESRRYTWPSAVMFTGVIGLVISMVFWLML